MTKRQGRLFFILCTFLSASIFLLLTIHSHTRFGQLTNADKITPEVLAGKDVWHANNCINCHTLLGEGAYYAPDLTKITQLRGAAYLKAFLKNPSQFYSEEKHRRLMPTIRLSDADIDHVIAFLDWVSHIDNQGWPPRPILVAGATIPGTESKLAGSSSPASADPIAQGESLFRAAPPGCTACHSVAPGVNLVGPSLAGLLDRAVKTVADPGYAGKAKAASDYIRESIVSPSEYIVPGATYSANGLSLMPANYGKDLTPEQIDSLVAYLQTLK